MKHTTIILVLFCAFVFSTSSYAIDIASGNYKVSVQSSLTVRNNPKTGEKIGSLYNENSVEVLECTNGWAKIKYGSSFGYVKADYLQPLELVESDTDDYNLNIITLDSIEKIQSFMPFVVLALTLLLWLFLSIDSQISFQITCFLLGLSELLLFIPINGGGGDSIPSFCEPNDVGWLFAIINFIIMVIILLFQYYIYRGFTRELGFGFWKNLFFTAFMFLGMLSFCAIFTVSAYSIIVFAIFFIVLLFILRGVGFFISLVFMIHGFGLLLSFINALGALIIGGIIWFILDGMAKDKSAGKERYQIGGTDTIIEQVHGDNFRDVRTNEPWIRTGYKEFRKV